MVGRQNFHTDLADRADLHGSDPRTSVRSASSAWNSWLFSINRIGNPYCSIAGSAVSEVSQLGLAATDVGNFFTKCRREIDLVLLLLNQNLSDLFGDRIFTHRFTLTDPFTIVSDRLVLII